MRKRILGICLLLGSAVQADTLPTVVVSATRSHEPGVRSFTHTEVLDEEDIHTSGAGDLTQLLRGRAGIHASDLYGDGSASSLDMRGFGANAGSNTLLIVDGHRMNPSTDSASLYLNRIDLRDLAQVEILQGSAGVLFGNQAVGGVIQMVTRPPEGFEARAGTALGSHRHWSNTVVLGDRAANGLGYRLSATRDTGDNYRDRNRFERENLALTIDHEHGDNRLWLTMERFDETVETPGALFIDEIVDDRRQAVYDGDFIDTESELIRFGLRHDLNAAWRLEADLAYSDDDRDFVQSFRTFAGTLSTQDRTTWELNPRVVGRIGHEGARSVLTLGADLRHTDYLLLGLGPQGVEQETRAIYAQLITPLGPRTELGLGMRHAQVRNDLRFEDFSVFPSALATQSIDDGVTVGSLGISHRPTPGWELFARADENYRFAKVDEHTNIVFGQPVGLDSQTGTTYELGARLTGRDTHLDLVLYRIDLDDEIHYEANQFSNTNIDGSRRRGVLISAGRRLGETLTLGGSYNFVDSEVSAGPFEGNEIPLVPEHKLQLYAEWRPLRGTHVRLEGLYVDGQRYGGDHANRFPAMDAYRLLNLNAGFDRGPWTITLRVNNLTDEAYSETGNIGFDSVAHAGCLAGGFGGFDCPSENPAPEINAMLGIEYRMSP